MLTPIENILELVNALIPNDYKEETIDMIDLCRLSLIECKVLTNKTYKLIEDDDNFIISPLLSEEDEYILSRYVYRNYLKRLRDEFNRGAVNFETITFKVKSLDERVKQLRYMIQEEDIVIDQSIKTLKEINNDFIDIAITEFGSDWNERR